ncbi:dihydroflavonol-4-reductase [Parafrankia irregularis]|uniref:Dihydroflavonol-4-reductase n=1 Tax=Parafrankia irregularis TaxID=795642 RepID=A0A0S4QMM4_9ACTN|nr:MULTISPECIES: NAD-dependent epimerase/dehydratase family protein [Parafrankia]MBE3200533.1 NAD-dependent epimerase/dehydratase family protein [Parafrankia sp. CH37]CUU56865.1 dihydroflavonol-4-reductase [Parafrankia irregularis]
MADTQLVMGASGFLGSHVTRQLAERGDDVRVWIRRTSSTVAFDDLQVERVHGELTDDAALVEAMRGVDTVYYCIVDARAWLRDPAPLFATNVEGLRHALDAAVEAKVRRFVFCSTVGTIGRSDDGRPADENDPNTWKHLGGPYIQARADAEDLVLRYCRERDLPGVVMNVSTTYGAPDHASPHGQLVADAARGKMPIYFGKASMEVVGIRDAARAFLLAAEKGRVGERYIISESYMTWKELVTIAAETGGVKPPRIGIPIPVMKVIGRLGDFGQKVLRRDTVMNSVSVRLMHFMPPLDHSKATRELGWEPSPTADEIREAANFYLERDRTKAQAA